MWLMFSDCFLSVVRKNCGPGEILVGARRRGDIERMFPSAKVTEDTKTDYLFGRSSIRRRSSRRSAP